MTSEVIEAGPSYDPRPKVATFVEPEKQQLDEMKVVKVDEEDPAYD